MDTTRNYAAKVAPWVAFSAPLALAIVLTDGGAPTLLANRASTTMFAYARTPALSASVALAIVLTE